MHRRNQPDPTRVAGITTFVAFALLWRAAFRFHDIEPTWYTWLGIVSPILMVVVAFGLWQRQGWTRAAIAVWVATNLVAFGAPLAVRLGKTSPTTGGAIGLAMIAALMVTLSALFALWWWRASARPADWSGG